MKKSINVDRGKDLINGLKISRERFGTFYPILEDYYGNILDGHHRLQADEDWPRMRLDFVRSDKEAAMVKLLCNVCRRTVSSEEKTEMLGELGRILQKEGVP